MPRTKQGVASALDLTNHEKEDWTKAHRIWENIRPLLAGSVKASVYLTTETGLTTNDWKKIPFETVVNDPGNIFDETTDYDFTVPVAGSYLISGSVQVHNAAGTSRQIKVGIYKNGTLFRTVADNPAQNYYTVVDYPFVATLELAADDTITIYVYCGGTAGSVAVHGGQAATNCGLLLFAPA